MSNIEHLCDNVQRLIRQGKKKPVCKSCHNKRSIMCGGCNQKQKSGDFSISEAEKQTNKLCKLCENNGNKERKRKTLDKQDAELQKLQCGSCPNKITETAHMSEPSKIKYLSGRRKPTCHRCAKSRKHK